MRISDWSSDVCSSDLKDRYLPLLDKAIARPWPFILGGLAFFLAAVPVFGLLGSEFIPQLDEKNLALASTRVPSVSLEQSLVMQRKVEEAGKNIPEVELMVSKPGTAEVATEIGRASGRERVVQTV